MLLYGVLCGLDRDLPGFASVFTAASLSCPQAELPVLGAFLRVARRPWSAQKSLQNPRLLTSLILVIEPKSHLTRQLTAGACPRLVPGPKRPLGSDSQKLVAPRRGASEHTQRGLRRAEGCDAVDVGGPPLDYNRRITLRLLPHFAQRE